MKLRIIVTLKKGVLDPQGQAITTSLQQMSFDQVDNAFQGKVIDLHLKDSINDLDAYVQEMCQKLLVNSVIENYSYHILDE